MAEYKGANDVVSIDDILDVCGKYITNKAVSYTHLTLPTIYSV